MESDQRREPRNKGKLVGQKLPLKPKDIWAIRIQLQNAHQFETWQCSIWRLTASYVLWPRESARTRHLARKTMPIIYLKFSYS